MKQKIVLLSTLAIGIATFLLRSHSTPVAQNDEPSVPIAVLDATPEPTVNAPDPILHGHPIHIIRRAKFPDELRFTGTALFTTPAEFLAFVGTKNARYLRWNNVDFATQSLLVFAKKYSGGVPPLKIQSLERAGRKLIVNVFEPAVNGSVTANITIRWDAVVIPKTDPPLEFRVQFETN
ncbi:MAG TPA: hypothetical protein VKX17_01920 [Planctomycetota bacterium]|nr:hypothetical protein [Planctomycetota bacterium]